MPMDLPQISLDLIDRFVNGRTFADIPLPSEQSYLDAIVSGEEEQELPPASPSNLSNTGSLFLGALMLVFVALVVASFNGFVPTWYVRNDSNWFMQDS